MGSGLTARQVARLSGGVLLLGFLALVAWIWQRQRPNEAARRFDAIFAARPAIAAADNAFIHAMGFDAPQGVDPRKAGADRIAWFERRLANVARDEPDPGADNVSLEDIRNKQSRRLVDACREGSAQSCGQAADVFRDGVPLTSMDELLSARYAALLSHTGWRELVLYGEHHPQPDYTLMLEAQRLALLRLRDRAERGDLAVVRDGLERDLVFWRMLLRDGDGLITKMIAVAAIRYHFMLSNLAMRTLPAGDVARVIPPSWQAPLTDEERSMWRAMAAEHQMAIEVLRDTRANAASTGDQDGVSVDRALANLRMNVKFPRLLNESARINAYIASTFEVPLDRYLAAMKAIDDPEDDLFETRQIASYALRAASVEGMRRLALATAELRSQGLGAQDAAVQVSKSRWLNPFDGRPFDWRPRDQSVSFTFSGAARHDLALLY